MITLPNRLGGIIRDSITSYRREHNIPEPDEVKQLSVYRRRDTFLESEFELVRELEIDKDTLAYIDLFPNITSLTIDCLDNLEISDLNNIIYKYPSLEKLSIKGQNNLQYLDVSKLKKLKNLELISNRGLHRVVGLEELESLSQLTFYDNVTYLKEEELCRIVSELAKKGVHSNLDVLYMPTMDRFGISHPENFNWCESVGLGIYGEEIKYSTQELDDAVKKAQEIVGNYIKPTDSTIQKFAVLYQWMCENVKYDFEALANDHIHTQDGQKVGQHGGTNGTVNGLVYGSCVCEGYSKSMQMLLKLCGIPSFDVSCIAEDPSKRTPSVIINGKKRMHNGDHSILKVNIDGTCYYSDVTWDANRFQNAKERGYFLLSKEDISKDHELVGEKNVFSAFKSVSKTEFQELMQFASQRIKTVDKELEDKKEMEKSPQEKLVDVNKELIGLRQQYSVIAEQIEELMKRNQQSPVPNFQEQLNGLISKRDKISEDMRNPIWRQQTYEKIIRDQEETRHKAILFQVERLLSMHITPIAGFDYDNELKVPRALAKDTSQLSIEQGQVIQRLNELYFDGELDLKAKQDMVLEVIKEYEKMKKTAPKPIVRDESTYSQDKEKNPNAPQSPNNNSVEQEETVAQPLQRPYINQETKEQVEEMHKKKYGYDTMNETERRKFDDQYKAEQTEKSKTKVSSPERKKLEEERRDLRRMQFADRMRKMGIDKEQVLDMDRLFEQQRIIEQMNLEQENLEQTEDFGMHM